MSAFGNQPFKKKLRTISLSPTQQEEYDSMSKHASNYLLPQKKIKEIRLRYKQEIEEMIDDEFRFQMIKQAEEETNNQNKLSNEKQV